MDGVPAGEIAVVAPHADGALRYLLGRSHIPFGAARRFSAPREGPAARLGLTLAALAHPDWQIAPHPWDVSEALAQVLDLDPVRATLDHPSRAPSQLDHFLRRLFGEARPRQVSEADSQASRPDEEIVARLLRSCFRPEVYLCSKAGEQPGDAFPSVEEAGGPELERIVELAPSLRRWIGAASLPVEEMIMTVSHAGPVRRR